MQLFRHFDVVLLVVDGNELLKVAEMTEKVIWKAQSRSGKSWAGETQRLLQMLHSILDLHGAVQLHSERLRTAFEDQHEMMLFERYEMGLMTMMRMRKKRAQNTSNRINRRCGAA